MQSPYVTESEKQEMERNVLDWEPFSALFVPDNDPLLFYRCIAELGKGMLASGGRLYFEINRGVRGSYGNDASRTGVHQSTGVERYFRK
mgnify:CR=1 FL=1